MKAKTMRYGMFFVAVFMLAVNSLANAANIAHTHNGAPEIFASGIISGRANDADPTFAPDGITVVFARNNTIMVSQRSGMAWTVPRIAPFSGRWSDQQPTMAPYGSFLVFVSNRLVRAGDAKGPSGNLWRVHRLGQGWGEAQHLPPSSTVAPVPGHPALPATAACISSSGLALARRSDCGVCSIAPANTRHQHPCHSVI